jgi:hypothetical protein
MIERTITADTDGKTLFLPLYGKKQLTCQWSQSRFYIGETVVVEKNRGKYALYHTDPRLPMHEMHWEVKETQ